MGLIARLLGLFRPPPVLQVAMLCTREGADGLEVLLVRSLDSGHWILPKGWPMDGRSLAEAAAIEAWEEAGARGDVLPHEVGRYMAAKRSSAGLVQPAQVVVFRMDRTVLHDDYPEADLRKRRFLPVEKAARRADLDAIGDLIRRVLG